MQPGSPFTSLLLAVLLCLCGLSSSHATTLEAYSFEELVQQSDLILQATVTGRHSESAAQGIRTYVDLQVQAVIKGDLAGQTLQLSFLGGEVDGDNLEVSGQFIPPLGELALFFINDPVASTINPLTGWFQGYFPILHDAASGLDYLDLRERPDLVLANLAPDPLLRKLAGLGLSEAELSAYYPDFSRFLLADFIAAIAAELDTAAVAP